MKGGSLSIQDVFAALETLYQDQLEPFGRILRKRLGERASRELEVDVARLKAMCESCPWLYVEFKEGGDWSVLIRGREKAFVDVYSPVENYPAELWQAAAEYFESLDSTHMVLPGGRYSCAQTLISRNLPFLVGLSLGQVCHVVQLAISQKKILGYLNGAVVPYGRSQSKVKDSAAERATHVKTGSGSTSGSQFADWPAVKEGISEILAELGPGAFVQLSNIKRLFRSKFQTELSETALGHAKLSDLLQDAHLHDICSVKLHGHGYVVSAVPRMATAPVAAQVSAAAAGASAVAALLAPSERPLRGRARVQPLDMDDVEHPPSPSHRQESLQSPAPLMTPTPSGSHAMRNSLVLDTNVWEMTCKNLGLVPPQIQMQPPASASLVPPHLVQNSGSYVTSHQSGQMVHGRGPPQMGYYPQHLPMGEVYKAAEPNVLAKGFPGPISSVPGAGNRIMSAAAAAVHGHH